MALVIIGITTLVHRYFSGVLLASYIRGGFGLLLLCLLKDLEVSFLLCSSRCR